MYINTAFLYIDPGTGSILISTAIGITLTVLFSLKGFFYNFIARISGRTIKKNNDFSGQMVFFSEGKNYACVFEPVVEELIKRKEPFIYLSADTDDPILKKSSEYCTSHYIGKLKQAIIFMNSIKAKMCVMTTPQLNILTLKRSKNVIHYCHLIHSPTDIHAYKKFAFDYFDSVLCSSTFQIDNLRQLEKDRKSKVKVLLNTGCTYLDSVKIEKNITGNAILLAPTWGEKSFFSICGVFIIEELLNSGHQIIYRPHPQSWISDKELVEDVVRKFENKAKFIVDKAVDNSNSIAESKIMICDMSGIVYDYVFTQRKPVIAVDFYWDNGGYESSDIEKETSTSLLLSDVGRFIKPVEAQNISSIVEEVLKVEISNEIIDRHIFNFGKASPIATTHILELFHSIS